MARFSQEIASKRQTSWWNYAFRISLCQPICRDTIFSLSSTSLLATQFLINLTIDRHSSSATRVTKKVVKNAVCNVNLVIIIFACAFHSSQFSHYLRVHLCASCLPQVIPPCLIEVRQLRRKYLLTNFSFLNLLVNVVFKMCVIQPADNARIRPWSLTKLKLTWQFKLAWTRFAAQFRIMCVHID